MRGILLRWLPYTRTVDSVNIIKQLIYHNIKVDFSTRDGKYYNIFASHQSITMYLCLMCLCWSQYRLSFKLPDNTLNQSTSVNNGKDGDNLNRTKKFYRGQEICDHLNKEREVTTLK